MKKLFLFKNSTVVQKHLNHSEYHQKLIQASQRILTLEQFRPQTFLLQILEGHNKQQDKDTIIQNFEIFYKDIFKRNNSLNQKFQRKDLSEFKVILPLYTLQIFYEDINTLWGFVENSGKGFLSQDFTTTFINKLQRILKQNKGLTDVIQEMQLLLQRDYIPLPEDGIPNPEIENQFNLFQRQLRLESYSNYIGHQDYINELTQVVITDYDYNPKTYSIQFANENFKDIFQYLNEIQQKAITNFQKKTSKNLNFDNFILQIQPENQTMIIINSIANLIMRSILNYNKDDSRHSEQNINIYLKELSRTVLQQFYQEIQYQQFYQSYIKYNKEHDFKILKYKDFKKTTYMTPKEISKEQLHQLQDSMCEIINFILMNLFYFTGTRKQGQLSTEKLVFEKVLYTGIKKEFHTVFKLKQKYQKFILKCLYDERTLFYQNFALPRIFEPAKWENLNFGGYYLKPTQFVRALNNQQKNALENSDLNEVFDIVNYIQNQSWKIDKKLLTTVEKIWELGGGKGNIPYRYQDSENQKAFNFLVEETYYSKRDQSEQIRDQMFQKMNNYSSKCDFLLKLQVAQKYKNIQKVYFPQNLDFRGRIYPIPPHLNHIGNDLCRSLLIFSKKKPLGKKGLRWLKIHLSNKLGMDKISFDDRVGYVEDNISKFEKWVEDPILNNDWMEEGDCWQCLGAANELISALKSDFPEDYLSDIPIHQDGTCNGLQHYAALGRDPEGALSVNLINHSKPMDLYTKVCDRVILKIKDLLSNPENIDEIQKQIYPKLIKVLKRKTIKQTVMTIVYGVTFIGGKEQIYKQLKTTYPYDSLQELSQASQLTTKLTFEVIGDIFSKAKTIQKFFSDCGKIITKQNQPLMWLTPLGFPVIQPYYQESTFDDNKDMKFELQKQLKINKNQQISAFPPNYIHSLDSTHLMMTARRMQQNNLDFGSVHDSFWTHACDVDDMNLYLREEFVKLYSMELLQDLKEGFQQVYPNQNFPDLPKQGSFDLREVLESTYFFNQFQKKICYLNFNNPFNESSNEIFDQNQVIKFGKIPKQTFQEKQVSLLTKERKINNKLFQTNDNKNDNQENERLEAIKKKLLMRRKQNSINFSVKENIYDDKQLVKMNSKPKFIQMESEKEINTLQNAKINKIEELRRKLKEKNQKNLLSKIQAEQEQKYQEPKNEFRKNQVQKKFINLSSDDDIEIQNEQKNEYQKSNQDSKIQSENENSNSKKSLENDKEQIKINNQQNSEKNIEIEEDIEEEDEDDENESDEYYETVTDKNENENSIPQLSIQEYENKVLKIDNLDLTDMKKFIMTPAPKGKVIQVSLIRDKSGIKKKFFPQFMVVFSENINHHILTAQKKAKNKSTNIVLSLSKSDFSRKSQNCLGKLRSNFTGTQFFIYDNGENPKQKKVQVQQIRKEYGFIEYEKNIMGFKGPRKLRVTIPKYDKDMYEQFQSIQKKEGIKYATELRTDKVQYFKNKPPQWNYDMQSFVLDFYNRVNQASVKNFQLVEVGDEQQNLVLQFGKVQKNIYNLDFSYPFSLFQAVSIALSSCEKKLFCEQLIIKQIFNNFLQLIILMETQKIFKVGIRREQFNKWERRCALPPKYCSKLLFDMEGQLQIKVQPSTSRVFTDEQFIKAGCQISDDITDCDLIIGVKQVPLEFLYPEKTYMFFSHVIKAQEQNMPMLDDILNKKIKLIDYEKITNEQGKRLVAFGRFAGICGTIDILFGLGNFLLTKGFGTPFINISQSYSYTNIYQAKNLISQIGKEIELNGIPSELVPFIFGVTGNGRSAQGSLEILELLPHEYVKPQNLESLIQRAKKNPKEFQKSIYIVQFEVKDLVVSKLEPNKFDKKDYYKNPSAYKNIFQQKYLPYLSTLIHCIYWEDKYCKVIDKKQFLKQWKLKNLRLQGISDVTCDYMGSIDFLTEFSTIDEPILLYHPDTMSFTKDFKTNTDGILYNSIENMPTQLPSDASYSFGHNLYPYIEQILKADHSKPLEQQGLPKCIENAVITDKGQLTYNYTYIQKLRIMKEKKKELQDIKIFRKQSTMGIHTLKLTGHLFDTNTINKILDCLIDDYKCLTAVTDWNIQGSKQKSSCVITLKQVHNIDQIMIDVKKICLANDVEFELNYVDQVLEIQQINIYNIQIFLLINYLQQDVQIKSF